MDDEDRDAILERRNRLIGLALAGLATVGCDTVLPGPCLEAMPIEAPETETEDGPQLPLDEHAPPRPVPCLSGQYIDPNAPNDEVSDDGTTDEATADEATTDEVPTVEATTDEAPAPAPRRRARRRRTTARPEAPPHPCLSVVPVEPLPPRRPRRPGEAAPQPCLMFDK